ncbi:AAA family ATPase [Peribacillus frigoritolerans]|uniref:AAA family ATPase n=1 Tax=Peribacillus frigoritolerans TaxID=450367 RepID=UPI002B246526|nr:AAA family ATPase [Peribacillus frigoritolerans]MEB2630227.1 AAA family ATPase [Peribacillus frigoritolerans]
MHIEKLKINSYRGLEDVNITFLKPKNSYFGKLKFSVLVGENGTGKTSILRALTRIFCPNRDLEPRERRELIDFKIRYEIDNKVFNYNTNELYPYKHPSKAIVSSYTVFDPYSPRPQYRDKIEQEPNQSQETNFVYCGPSEAFFNTNRILIRSLIQAITHLREGSPQWGAFNKLKEKLLIGKTLFLELDRNIDSYHDPDVFDGNRAKIGSEERELAKDVYRNVNKYRVPKNDDLNVKNGSFLIEFKDFTDSLKSLYESQFIADKRTFIRDIWFEKDGKKVSLSDLSSGEITLLFRFLPLLIEMKHNSIVLIDEPETHLHPVWAQQFIDYLVDMFREFNAHFILATHSPLIVADLPLECIVGLNKNKNTVQQYLPTENTLGGDPSELLKEVFGLGTLKGKFTLELLEEIQKLLDKGGFEDVKKAREIFNDMSISTEKYKLFTSYRNYLEE